MIENNDNKLISRLVSTFGYKRFAPQFWLLVDPDKIKESSLHLLSETAQSLGVDAILVGSSILLRSPVEDVIRIFKANSEIPIILFPGGKTQLCSLSDAMLFLTFLSSRNPRWLIEEQVLAASDVKSLGIPTIPTGYLLFESGITTSVGFFSTTPPLPRDKPELAVAHGLAAQFMGMRALYLDAGSGAKKAVPLKIIKSVRENVDLTLIVGGGIRSPELSANYAKYADVVVVGNYFEEEGKLDKLSEFAERVHSAR